MVTGKIEKQLHARFVKILKGKISLEFLQNVIEIVS